MNMRNWIGVWAAAALLVLAIRHRGGVNKDRRAE